MKYPLLYYFGVGSGNIFLDGAPNVVQIEVYFISIYYIEG
jgi:hypothetical protein